MRSRFDTLDTPLQRLNLIQRPLRHGTRPVPPGAAPRRDQGCELPARAPFNFSNEIQISVLDTVNQILAIMNSSPSTEGRNEASNEIQHQYLGAGRPRKIRERAPLFTHQDVSQ
jgi:hypothetical protein